MKTIIVIVIVILAAGWGIGNGLIRWESDPYACAFGRGYYSEVPQQRWLAFGKLGFYYQPFNYGCEKTYRYSPKEYRMENGILTPIHK